MTSEIEIITTSINIEQFFIIRRKRDIGATCTGKDYLPPSSALTQYPFDTGRRSIHASAIKQNLKRSKNRKSEAPASGIVAYPIPKTSTVSCECETKQNRAPERRDC